jgi:hypothetical protein
MRLGRDKEAEVALNASAATIESIATGLKTDFLSRAFVSGPPVLEVFKLLGRRARAGHRRADGIISRKRSIAFGAVLQWIPSSESILRYRQFTGEMELITQLRTRARSGWNPLRF